MTTAIVRRRRVMFMSEAWVLIAIAPVLYLLSTSGHRGLRFLMLAFIFLVVGDGLLSLLLTRSIRVAAQLPSTVDVGVGHDVPIEITWPIRGPVIAHFTSGLVSEKAGSPADVQGTLASVATRRGTVNEVTITTAAGAFLGLIGYVTESTLTPAVPMLAVPPAVPHPEIVAYLQTITTPSEPELVGVRPYRPGDRPADVHWPSVARTSEMMVRERVAAPLEAPPLTIDATDTTPGRLDLTLGLARFAVERAWQLGVPVTLVTHEASEPNPSHTSTSRFQIPYVPPTRRVEPRLAVRELEGPADLHRALASAIAGPSTDRALDGYHLVIGELTPDIP